MGFKLFERELGKSSYYLMGLICKLRLGYEIVNLYDNLQTRKNLKISGREYAGIGIDSDVSKQFLPDFLISQFDDYHTWSLFNRDRIGMGLFSPDDNLYDLQLRVICLITDDEMKDKNRMMDQIRINPITGESTTIEVESPHFNDLVDQKFESVKSEDKLKAIENRDWRNYAKKLCGLGLQYQSEYFSENRERLLEELADVPKGKKILKSSEPTIKVIEDLINLYIREMK